MIHNVLFKINDWTICKLPDDHIIRDLALFVHHAVCPNTRVRDEDAKNEISWLRGELPLCWTCNTPIPDEIQALMHLHEWGKAD